MVEPEDAAVTLVLLHGRGHTPASMHALAERLELAHVACVAPAAPGGSWYPKRFVAPRAANQPYLAAALAIAHQALDDLDARGVPAARVVLGGFSQGACLACEAIASRPRPLGGLVSLCGGLIGASTHDLPRPGVGSLAGLPVLLTGTEQDSWVPVDRVRETARILREADAVVDLRISVRGPHEVHPDEVDAVRELVLSVAALIGH